MTPIILSHPLYTKSVSNLERTAVRDKLARLVQYFSRFLSYYAYRKGYSGETVAQLKAIVTYFSMARKIFRLGKPLGLFRAVVGELTNHAGSRVKHYANLGRNAGLCGFLTMDALVLVQQIGAYKFSAPVLKRIQTNGNRLWLVAMVSNVVDATYSAYVESLRIKALKQDEKSSDDEFKRAQTDRKRYLTALVWNLTDTLLPLSGLGYINANDGIVGLAGTLTSYLGLLQVW